ncbi:MAG: glycosyltransferase family 1 protein [Flavobacteriia bacterium]|nr:glycosyltransferase family 1 protein [Flavobacteriia bacterium]
MEKTTNGKVKVLRVLNRFNVGGPVWNVMLLTKHLPESYETMLVGGVATQEEGDALSLLDLGDVDVTIIPTMSRKVNLFKDVRTLLTLRSIIRKHKPEIVHTHASKAGFLGRLAAVWSGVPVIVHTFHGHVFEGYFGPFTSRIIRSLERWLARRSNAIVAISAAQKKDLVEKYRIVPSYKVHVIPLGFDLKRFKPNETKRYNSRKQYQLKEKTIAVGIVGRLTEIKNHTLFLSAASKLLDQTALDFQFFVVGDGALKQELMQKAKALNLERKLVFTSWIGAMETFYPAMDIVCLTSFNEGTPVSLIEAQASGIPVISTRVGGVADIIVHEKTGILLDTFNPEELAEKILHLANQPILRAEMSKNAHNFVFDRYNYMRLIAEMENLYQNLMRDAKN